MSEKTITIGGETRELELERDGATFRAGEHVIEIVSTRGQIAELVVDGEATELRVGPRAAVGKEEQ